ncbi:MAG: FGGY-family carbohydrate kinase [Pseudomonadota bacterium]
MDLILGLDAGSSVCKAAVFDLAGRVVSSASTQMPVSRPGEGRVEADPNGVWHSACHAIKGAVAGAAGRGQIIGMGVTGAMVGAWVIGAHGEILRPGIIWEDSRAQALIDAMVAERPTLYSDIFAVSGSVMQQGCTLPVVASLMQSEPEIMAEARAVIGLKDWLRMKLTGEIATDRSEAAVAPGDARLNRRSQAMFDLFALGDHKDLFPTPKASQEIAGTVTEAASRLTGLPAGLPVAVGAGDVIANVIGAGGLRPGSITSILGTTCMVGLCHDEPVFEPPDIGLLFPMPESHWFRAMVNVAGTLNLDWAVSLFYPDLAKDNDRNTKVTTLADAVPIGSRGVTYLPYLSESGIIAPVADAEARAQFAGLTPLHGPADMIRAVYEGVAFSIADLCDLLTRSSDEPLVLTGGGASSPLWHAMIAEVTGRPVTVPDGGEFGARGAALLAGVAIGRFSSVVEASATVAGGGRTVVPTGKDAAAWSAARTQYTRTRDRALMRD